MFEIFFLDCLFPIVIVGAELNHEKFATAAVLGLIRHSKLVTLRTHYRHLLDAFHGILRFSSWLSPQKATGRAGQSLSKSLPRSAAFSKESLVCSVSLVPPSNPPLGLLCTSAHQNMQNSTSNGQITPGYLAILCPAQQNAV